MCYAVTNSRLLETCIMGSDRDIILSTDLGYAVFYSCDCCIDWLSGRSNFRQLGPNSHSFSSKTVLCDLKLEHFQLPWVSMKLSQLIYQCKR